MAKNAHNLPHISYFLFHISRYALDIIFPPLCVGCDTYIRGTGVPLCDACRGSITQNTTLSCPICAARLADNKRICKHGKRASKDFPYLLGAASHYADPVVRTCIHACKYEGVHSLSDVLCSLLVEYAQGLHPQPSIFAADSVVVPIPLHLRKERMRGFNQSAVIARSFAAKMHLPYDELLMKLVDNDAQARTKTYEERFTHMRSAFAVPRPQDVQNKNIILIDDVSTSGATLSEAARTLKAAGARQILALVIAKA